MTTATMKVWIQESSPRFEARLAGFLYLLIILGGLFAPFAVAPSGMMLGDAALPTAAKILAAKHLYIIGGIAQLLVYTCDIGVALIFCHSQCQHDESFCTCDFSRWRLSERIPSQPAAGARPGIYQTARVRLRYRATLFWFSLAFSLDTCFSSRPSSRAFSV